MMNETIPRLILPVGDRDHIQGRADAPLTLVEYGDFESIKLSADKKSYWIEYPTRPDEIKVLGPRAVTVEVGTWKAAIVMRD